MCGIGNASKGASSFLQFLQGDVCPQPLALVMSGHAALPVMHRFIEQGNRPALWLYGESGSYKSALVRAAMMALWAPKFTAERGDGLGVTKWDSTYNGLDALMFT